MAISRFCGEMGFENAFTCMEGGESAILPHTLNMALHVGDEAALVIRNREKAARALSISLDRTVTCAQIHGSQIAVVDAAPGWPWGKGLWNDSCRCGWPCIG